MSFRPADQAMTDLSEYFTPLGKLIDAAHHEFIEQCREIAHKLEMRSRASIYRDLIVRKLREFCDETPGVTFISKRQLRIVGLKNNWIIRVKRLRSGFTVAVSPTIASRQYDANEVPDALVDLLPNNPPATCLYLGWSVPENAPSSILKFLVCNDERREFAWAIPLGSDEPPAPSVVEELPFPPSGPDEGPRRRVRIRRAATRKADE